ncbi:substrate-binding domain-containing protein [uncultured Anaerococcus sp.]|uniref:substrate-binding domain-containing protein n=1 Tax=uncultured Anaerococcus sp. TaxID=293428 RepID=UPI002889D179|nr:substrate-binding domain-containing protein [uncultured Anaerococcus sp.]
MKNFFKKTSLAIMGLLLVIGLSSCSSGESEKNTTNEKAASEATDEKKEAKDMNFVIVPKVVAAWFDEVNKGAQQQADLLSKQLGVKVTIDYRAPENADVAEQNRVLEQAAATNPAGIAVDPVDYEGSKAIIEQIREQGIPVVIFDAIAPEDSGLTSIGNDFSVQAIKGAEILVDALGKKGTIAIMQGVPSAPNHNQRYEAYKEYLSQFPDIKVIDAGLGNDSVEESKQQASAILASNPDINGFLMCDASAPVGIATAVEEAGKTGKITIVGLENLSDILALVKEGKILATSCTRPYIQGSNAVLMLWQKYNGIDTPKFVDTGIDIVNKDNVDEWIEIMK